MIIKKSHEDDYDMQIEQNHKTHEIDQGPIWALKPVPGCKFCNHFSWFLGPCKATTGM